ncbi:Aerobic cobaltochelatase subunit CobT [Nymphon striatum]|nr:Aerobic cobaltochelatase subunit CobT [Nymphon striatum]
MIDVRKTFGIDVDLEVPAFTTRNAHVPEIDPDYIFDKPTTLAILAGFAHNRRVMVSGYHGTGKSTHIEQVAARLNWPAVRINLDSHVSRIDLVGKDAINARLWRNSISVASLGQGKMAGPGDNSAKRPNQKVDTEPFKRAVTGCMRAIAGEDELEVVFSSDKPAFAGNHARVPDLPKRVTKNDVMVTRGVGDSMALRAACHDSAVHRTMMPEGDQARAIYEAVEQARVESIGARRMPGVGDNLAAMVEDKFIRNNLSGVTEKENAPIEEAIGLVVRERLTGRKTPEGAAPIANLWRKWINDKAGDEIDQLAENIEDQEAFAKKVRDILFQMEMAEDYQGDGQDDKEQEDQEEAPPENDDEEDDGGLDDQESGDETTEKDDTPVESEQSEAGDMDASDATADDMDENFDQEAEEPGEAQRPDPGHSRHPIRH